MVVPDMDQFYDFEMKEFFLYEDFDIGYDADSDDTYEAPILDESTDYSEDSFKLESSIDTYIDEISENECQLLNEEQNDQTPYPYLILVEEEDYESNKEEISYTIMVDLEECRTGLFMADYNFWKKTYVASLYIHKVYAQTQKSPKTSMFPRSGLWTIPDCYNIKHSQMRASIDVFDDFWVWE